MRAATKRCKPDEDSDIYIYIMCVSESRERDCLVGFWQCVHACTTVAESDSVDLGRERESMLLIRLSL